MAIQTLDIPLMVVAVGSEVHLADKAEWRDNPDWTYNQRKDQVNELFSQKEAELNQLLNAGFRPIASPHEFTSAGIRWLRWVLWKSDASADGYEYDVATYDTFSVQRLFADGYLSDGWEIIATKETGSQTTFIFRRAMDLSDTTTN